LIKEISRGLLETRKYARRRWVWGGRGRQFFGSLEQLERFEIPGDVLDARSRALEENHNGIEPVANQIIPRCEQTAGNLGLQFPAREPLKSNLALASQLSPNPGQPKLACAVERRPCILGVVHQWKLAVGNAVNQATARKHKRVVLNLA
jgi:hypothetical protein